MAFIKEIILVGYIFKLEASLYFTTGGEYAILIFV